MKPPNTVIERGLGGPICGECQRLLAVAGPLNRICMVCHPQFEFIELLGDALGAENSRELDVLADLMKKKDMTARGVIRHMFRLGQMVDTMTAQGYEMVFRLGDEEVDPFDRGPKMAPMPMQKLPIPVTATDPACDEEGCGHALSAHFSCEVGSFCKECHSSDDVFQWEHGFKPICPIPNCPHMHNINGEHINPDPGHIRHGL